MRVLNDDELLLASGGEGDGCAAGGDCAGSAPDGAGSSVCVSDISGVTSCLGEDGAVVVSAPDVGVVAVLTSTPTDITVQLDGVVVSCGVAVISNMLGCSVVDTQGILASGDSAAIAQLMQALLAAGRSGSEGGQGSGGA